MSINTDGFSKTFGYMTKQPQGWGAYMNSDAKKINQGQRIIANGTINLEETDNGWRVSNFSNSNYKTVSSSYVTENMVSEIKNKKAELENQGDWSQSDIAERKLEPIYLESKDVPIFENAITKFEIKKSPSCSDCRNDNINDIASIIKETLIKTNRYSTSENEVFSSFSNTTNWIITINSISFKHLGLDKVGKDKGYSCTIHYSNYMDVSLNKPQQLNFKDSKSYFSSTSVFYYYKDKKTAFKAATDKISEQISEFVFKAEPIVLNVMSIELDKKGNPEFIVFDNPNKNIFNTKKIDFNIIEKSTFSFKNSAFQIGNQLGTVEYDKSKYSSMIICPVKNNKLKKQLMDFINNKEALIGLSN
jgi:hypothetical protein